MQLTQEDCINILGMIKSITFKGESLDQIYELKHKIIKISEDLEPKNPKDLEPKKTK